MKIAREKKYDSQAIKLLSEAFNSLVTPKEVQQFLTDLCTPAELQALADRWLVVSPLKKEMPYREIHEKTKVSVTTIGRVARCLHSGSGGYELAYERVRNNANKNQ